MVIILVTLFAFLIPVAFVLWREWKKNKEREAREGIVAKKKERVPPAAVAKATFIIVLLAVPVYLFSDISYSHFRPEESMLKVAFKHTGQRVEECDETGMVKTEGERYRRELKDTRQVKMNVEKLARCPRERHPVTVELFVDGTKALDKAYSPTGLKKDMASYIYDEFMITPGRHSFRVLLYNNGKKDSPAYALEQSMNVKPGEIKVVWFNEKAGALVLE